MNDVARRLTAETLGTGLLVATVVGSGIMAERLSQDDAVALLANAVATAGMLFVLITTFGPISGAHLNPVVTLVLMLRRELGRDVAAAYMLVQFVGAAAGTVLAHAMFEMQLVQLSTQSRSGGGQFLSEGVATFGLVAVIRLSRHRPAVVAPTVALYIGAAYWFTASTSFANPAVTVARAPSDTFSGIAPADTPLFIVAQLAGGLAALGISALLLPARKSSGPLEPSHTSTR